MAVQNVCLMRAQRGEPPPQTIDIGSDGPFKPARGVYQIKSLKIKTFSISILKPMIVYVFMHKRVNEHKVMCECCFICIFRVQ